MGIISASIGLVIAFIIIISILIYFVINSDVHVFIKAGVISVAIWYSIVLFYTPPKLMGWPTYQDMPDDSRIVYALVKEPRGDDGGGMYFLLLTTESTRPLVEQINPKHIFDYSSKNTPRLYRIPYDRELHKALMKARKGARKVGGMLRIQRKKIKGQRGDGRRPNKNRFVIKMLDPMKLLKKD